jgi:hypothetical protein
MTRTWTTSLTFSPIGRYELVVMYIPTLKTAGEISRLSVKSVGSKPRSSVFDHLKTEMISQRSTINHQKLRPQLLAGNHQFTSLGKFGLKFEMITSLVLSIRS